MKWFGGHWSHVLIFSWFDLLMVEVQKLEEQNKTVVTGPGKQTLEPKSDLVTELAQKPEISPHSPTNSSHTPDISPTSSPHRKPSKLQLPSLQSSQLAAAIVNSAQWALKLSGSVYYTVSSQKYALFSHTTLWQKYNGGVCSNTQFVSCILSPPFIPCNR